MLLPVRGGASTENVPSTCVLDTLLTLSVPRWASRRPPKWARDLADTDDLVQNALLQTFKRIQDFESRHVT